MDRRIRNSQLGFVGKYGEFYAVLKRINFGYVCREVRATLHAIDLSTIERKRKRYSACN